LLGGCAVVVGCSMIVAWLQTRSSTGAASSGSSPWNVANWHAGVAEDNRRVSNGDQVSREAALAMKRGKSVDFTGYWQRHIAD
jgi:hypothetical protein